MVKMLCDIRIFKFDNSNGINHLIFCSINLMVIKVSVCIISCVVCACDRALHCIALHCIRVKWQAQYGLLSFLSGFKWIASHYFCEFHFSSVFSSYQCVSTHIEIAKRKGHCATRQQFNTMNGVSGVVFTDMLNNKGMATTTSAAQRQQPTNQPTNEN